MRIKKELCLSSRLKGAISIKALKRFVADRDTGQWKRYSKKLPPTGKKVAIVGSGPAGLTAGYYLVRRGHSVTVFEALSKAGGMMRVGIPDYRLPKDVLDVEIKEIKDAGVEIKLNIRISSVDQFFEQGYDAVFLALGSHRGLKLGMEGENTPGVVDGATLLRDVALGKKAKVGQRVAVIGGGNTAIDSARTALRLGARQVQVMYRRSQAEMPASNDEVGAAIREGIRFSFLTSPRRVEEQGSNLKLTCTRNELGEVDASGRRRPVAIKGSEFSERYDIIIAATGQEPEIPADFKLKTNEDNTFEVDADTLATSRKGVWAGGDAVTGPASVIEAIADGRKAAVSIDKYLGGNGVIDERLTRARRGITAKVEDFVEIARAEMPLTAPGKRIFGFDETELGLSEAAAAEESSRCLRCGDGVTARCRYACPAGIDVPLYVSLISEGRYDDAIAVIREKVPFPRVLGRICTSLCEDACMGCAKCVPYCPMSAIGADEERVVGIEQDECVECGVCFRAKVCPVNAIVEDVQTWPRSVRAAFSNPLILHKETRVPGRGTEEVKTNDVTGQFRKGFVGVTAEMGRPGIGVRFHDVQKVAQALARAKVVFAPNNPVTHLMTDRTTGTLDSEILDEKVCSAMIESVAPIGNLETVIQNLKEVAPQITSVFSLTISTRLDEDGTAPCTKTLNELGISLYINGKTNIGIGRPLFREESR